MSQPAAAPAYPFYTLIMNTGYEPGTRIQSVFAYISPTQKVRVELIEGYERIEVERPLGGDVWPPQWEPCDKYQWVEVLTTKKQFQEAVKRFKEVLKATQACQAC